MENPASGASSDRALALKARRTRERILRAALALFFARKGYEATTMRAAAREAGISLGPAYHWLRLEGGGVCPRAVPPAGGGFRGMGTGNGQRPRITPPFGTSVEGLANTLVGCGIYF
jgi:Bacterial regulatory proteins, tetR family